MLAFVHHTLLCLCVCLCTKSFIVIAIECACLVLYTPNQFHRPTSYPPWRKPSRWYCCCIALVLSVYIVVGRCSSQSNWSNEKVCSWLTECGLAECVPHFQQHGIIGYFPINKSHVRSTHAALFIHNGLRTGGISCGSTRSTSRIWESQW